MTTYTVIAAYHDRDCRATVEVEADTYDEACRKAIEAIDSGDVPTDIATWVPGPTFVYGVVEGLDDPWNGIRNVPLEFRESAPSQPLTDALRRARILIGLLTVRQVLEAGTEAITAAGLTPGLIQSDQNINPSFLSPLHP